MYGLMYDSLKVLIPFECVLLAPDQHTVRMVPFSFGMGGISG